LNCGSYCYRCNNGHCDIMSFSVQFLVLWACLALYRDAAVDDFETAAKKSV
jgi:hypothetical protein